ncbi:hypothetical protein IFM61606_04335 [Aspergillus udagawae]|uniref:Uncharacterized protein n=1 Tax=Aspergillus udagawae TaxID=91492 RepID=A0ABQ1AZA4_9EURO|nr:hypothetical protein IFM51744_04782 [Aspergillus udagawae]GFF90837.1 hypothetical protein IFM53868_06300 [Aspergillus udagawae]GFG14431.1 hypothetical protein IFM5058_06944 [Aspergillus udagawae]GFG24426.1 hypothetical protein IFM61606_04335 [Aspergillus udagawae]
MCYYMPNKPPCTCTYLQLIQPCPQVRVFAVPGRPTPLIQVCPIRYIARGVGQRFCALCSRAAGFGGPGTVGLVGYPEQQGFGGPQLASSSQRSQQQVTPLDPCLVGGGVSIGDLLLPIGEESMGSLGTAGDAGRRDEAGQRVQGSCSSELSIQSLLVQAESGGGLIADAHGAAVPGTQVDEVWTVQAGLVVEEEASNGGNGEVRADRNEDERDHAKVGGFDREGRAAVQGMQIVLDLDEKSSTSG